MKTKLGQYVFTLMILILAGCSHSIYRESSLALQVSEQELTIVQHQPDLKLRQHNPLYLPNRRIVEDEFKSHELQDLIERMRSQMHKTGGIGISANQIGKRLQVFMIEAKSNNPRYKVLGPVPFQIFINPRIVLTSKERMNFWHGCLSAVGEKRGNVATYQWIEFEARDMMGKVHRGRLEGLTAVIFQHEFRHMLGGTYLDKAHTFLSKEELDPLIDQGDLPFFERTDLNLPLLLDDYRVGETLDEYYQRLKVDHQS